MNTKDAWYSHDVWDKEAQEVFLKKIKRTRTQKAYYIRAKASHLLFSKQAEKIAGAIALCDFGMEECPDSDLLTGLYLIKAKGHEALKNFDEATNNYRKVLELEQDKELFVRITKAWYYYAFFVLSNKLEDLYAEVLEVLEANKKFLVEEKFIYHYCKALIFQQKGQHNDATHEAKLALSLLDITHSGFNNQAHLGLVNREEFKEYIAVLDKLSSDIE